MVKTKRKSILRTLLCAVFALCFAVGLSSLFASGTTAYAATTPKYTVKFNWSTKTTTGTGGGTGSNTASGSGVSYSMQTGQYSFVDYSVTLYGSSSSGTGTFESGSYIGSNSVNVIINSKVKIPTTISGNGTTVRRLKAKGIGVYFEEQALDSLKTENEMALGLYSVLAQAESENISANVRWGIRQRMQSGTFKFRYNLLGYRKGDDGNPEIVEEEAQYVRAIFNMYLDGKSLDQIKSYLEGEGVLTKTGKNVWNKCIIQAILTNERYCGDLLMQKTFTENCITKKVKKNRGEMPKYLIRDNHPAIITHATFKMAQMEMARRGSVRKKTDSGITEQGKYSGKFALTDILVCGECGSPYRRKTYSRNGENKRVWRCLSRLEHGTEFCSDSITVDDETLKKTIVRGISKAISDKQDVLNLILSNLAYAVTGEDDTLEMYAIEKQLKTLSGIMDETMELAASSTGDGKRFQEEMKSLSSQMVVLREQLEIIKGRIDSNKKVNEEIENIKQCLSADSLDFSEYNDVTIRRLVEYIRVMKDNSIIIVLKGGMKIQENI